MVFNLERHRVSQFQNDSASVFRTSIVSVPENLSLSFEELGNSATVLWQKKNDEASHMEFRASCLLLASQPLGCWLGIAFTVESLCLWMETFRSIPFLMVSVCIAMNPRKGIALHSHRRKERWIPADLPTTPLTRLGTWQWVSQFE